MEEANAVSMTWFELDVAGAHMTDEEAEACDLGDHKEEALENGEVELTWFEIDAIHQNAQTRKAKNMLAEKADEAN